MCVAQLVAPQWVVTAAHCTIYSAPADLVVVAGVDSLQGQGSDPCVERRLVEQIFNHPGYISLSTGNADDISLLKLAGAVNYAGVDRLDDSGPQSIAQPGACCEASPNATCEMVTAHALLRSNQASLPSAPVRAHPSTPNRAQAYLSS